MTVNDFVKLRRNLGFSQTAMARAMGMSLGALQTIEAGTGALSRRHQMLAERAALTAALEQGNPALMPPAIRQEVFDMVALMRGG